MKFGKTIITVRREEGKTLHDEVDTVIRTILGEPNHELRRLLARIARGETKTYLDQAGQNHLDQFEMHAAAVKAELTAAFANEFRRPTELGPGAVNESPSEGAHP